MQIPRLLRSSGSALCGVAFLGIVTGGGLALAGKGHLAGLAWAGATLVVLAALLIEIVTSLRKGQVGLDVVAALSMSAAIILGEPLAGNVVALMYAGGQLLEQFAQDRARREMTALLGRVAHTAMRFGPRGLEDVAIERIAPGDRLLIRHGEVIPVDGQVVDGHANIDTSALTGEPMPVERTLHEEVLSGTTSVGAPFELQAIRPASASAYAGVVRLVEAAQQARAPAVRLADRYALWFLLLTVLLAALAWSLVGDPLRALAVLVVATPCPLILAVPVAIMAGISRAAGMGVLVKGGGALEALGEVRVAVLDKTGTLTQGRPILSEVQVKDGFTQDEVLGLAASLDQASTHVMAAALVEAAHNRGLILHAPMRVEETDGSGLTGWVGDRHVVLGGAGFVRARVNHDPAGGQDVLPGGVTVEVGIDGKPAGILHLEDPVRAEAAEVIRRLRDRGIGRIVLATGDRADLAVDVGRRLDLDAVQAELAPAGKVEVVLNERARAKVLMVGDGVNDAPALAAADIGVAMGARGAAASSESADVVLLVDQLGRLADAMDVAHRARRIALQSVSAGLGLSIAAMVIAAFGYLPPVQGALLQEVIDVAVILNALRALRG